MTTIYNFTIRPFLYRLLYCIDRLDAFFGFYDPWQLKGDGAHDNTWAIKARGTAFGVVKFPPGTFRVTQSINVR